MRTFLNHIKNETLDEIKTSLENFWQQMIQLSEFFQYSFVLILKRKCLVRASRVRSGESGTPSTIIYVRWSSRRYELGCDTPVVYSSGYFYRCTRACRWKQWLSPYLFFLVLSWTIYRPLCGVSSSPVFSWVPWFRARLLTSSCDCFMWLV